MDHTFGPNEWFLKLRKGLHLGPRPSNTWNQAILLVDNQILDWRSYMRVWVQGLKRWSDTIATSLSNQISSVSTQENTLPEIEKPIFNLGPFLSSNERSILDTKVFESKTLIELPTLRGMMIWGCQCRDYVKNLCYISSTFFSFLTPGPTCELFEC